MVLPQKRKKNWNNDAKTREAIGNQSRNLREKLEQIEKQREEIQQQPINILPNKVERKRNKNSN